MQNHQSLLALCHTLASEGSTPSVALLRARATQKISLQTAIKVVQMYQQGIKAESMPTPIKHAPDLSTKSLEHRVTALEQQVAELKAFILQNK